nr:replication protein A 70 kDa DNA-binding subunit B-like [Ipomoea batatas]
MGSYFLLSCADGEVRICSSFDATQLFFNHSCKEFRKLRNRYNTKLTPLRCIQSSSRLCGANMDFSQSSNDLVDNYCKRKLIEKGGMMVCGGCKSSWHEGVVRYKVIVRVADDTGDAPMLIWDRECSDLVGVSASDLLAKYPEGNKGIPPELGCLRGLSMLYRILMKKDQDESYYSAFTVLSICRDENALAQHCSNLLGSNERDGISGDGHCVSGDFFSSDEEDCVAVEEVSQCSGLEKVTGLEDFEEGFGVDGVDVTLKRSLLKDFDRCGSSKKSKGIVVNEEK